MSFGKEETHIPKRQALEARHGEEMGKQQTPLADAFCVPGTLGRQVVFINVPQSMYNPEHRDRRQRGADEALGGVMKVWGTSMRV